MVLAVGVSALRGLAASSPMLAATREFGGFTRLRGTDCLAIRLWFDSPVTLPYSANPAWGFEEGTGTTFFDLRAIQAPKFDDEPGAVIEIDFYNSAAMLALSDADLVERAHGHLKAIVPALRNAKVLDSAVVRLPNSVNGSAPDRTRCCQRREAPPSRTSSTAATTCVLRTAAGLRRRRM